MRKTFLIISILMLFIIICTISIFIAFPKKLFSEIDFYSKKYGLDSSLVASVINIESSYDANAISSVGAMGLMQILPSTAYDIADRLDMDFEISQIYDEEINLELGCFYLSYLLNMFDYNTINALCAYNWGLSNVKDWINKGNVDASGTITNIPIKETYNYIKKYNVNKFVYKNLYGYS